MKESEAMTNKVWLETKDLLEIYGISRNTLKKWMDGGIVPKPEIDTGRMKRWHCNQILKV
ncbi:MAG: hypothetical protein ISR34_11380 [Pirellulales bacterium]|nr:hypothetical protein [Pirellulales bacterium]